MPGCQSGTETIQSHQENKEKVDRKAEEKQLVEKTPPLADVALPAEAKHGTPSVTNEMAAASQPVTRETIVTALPKQLKELYFRKKYGDV